MATNLTTDRVAKLSPRAYVATALSIVGAVAAFIAILLSAWQLNRTREAVQQAEVELKTLEARKAETVRALERLQRATVEQQQILRDLAQRAAADTNVPNELVRRARESIVTTQRATAEAAAVVPVIGLVLAGEWQRTEAEKVADILRNQGFQIQVIRPIHPNAIAPRQTAVRHYRSRRDPGEATQIANMLQHDFGLTVEIQRAPKIDNPPNKYEIWFGQTAFGKNGVS